MPAATARLRIAPPPSTLDESNSARVDAGDVAILKSDFRAAPVFVLRFDRFMTAPASDAPAPTTLFSRAAFRRGTQEIRGAILDAGLRIVEDWLQVIREGAL